MARALRAVDPLAEIVGVDSDPHVLRLGRRRFGTDRLRLEVVAEDALQFLRRERRRFDLIVEDLFVGSLRSVRKPAGFLGEGYRLMHHRLSPRGVMVSNTIHETPAVLGALRRLGGRTLKLGVCGHWNRIVVWGRDLPRASEFRRLLRDHGGFGELMSRVAVRTG